MASDRYGIALYTGKPMVRRDVCAMKFLLRDNNADEVLQP